MIIFPKSFVCMVITVSLLFLFLEVIRMLEKDGKVHFDRTDYESMLKRDLQ